MQDSYEGLGGEVPTGQSEAWCWARVDDELLHSLATYVLFLENRLNTFVSKNNSGNDPSLSRHQLIFTPTLPGKVPNDQFADLVYDQDTEDWKNKNDLKFNEPKQCLTRRQRDLSNFKDLLTIVLLG